MFLSAINRAAGLNDVSHSGTVIMLEGVPEGVTEDTSRNKTIRAVDTTFRILEALKEHNGMRVTELAEELSMPKSSVHRHLSTLHQREYVAREGDVFHIGLRFLAMGFHAQTRQEGYELVTTKVSQVAEETGERAQFLVEEHGKAVYLHREFGHHAVRINLKIGERIPLHAISPGKAILSQWPDSRVENYLENYPLIEFTDRTITDPAKLWEEIETIRERGFSVNREEFVDEICSVGVAISSPAENVLGAISVSGPTHRMSGPRFETEIPELLMGTAHEIELNLKYDL